MNNDGRADIVTEQYVMLGNGKGEFGSAISHSTPSAASSLVVADMNNDGSLDLVTGGCVKFGNGDGSFGNTVEYSAGFLNQARVTDVNGDGLQDIIQNTTDTYPFKMKVLLNQGNYSFATSITADFEGDYFALGDFNEDGISEIVSMSGDDYDLTISRSGTNNVTTQPYLNISTQANARGALPVLDNLLGKITSTLGTIGSFTSRLEAALGAVHASKINFDAAASRITDIDIAEESANSVKNQILQEVGAKILAEVNQAPQISLSLLQ